VNRILSRRMLLRSATGAVLALPLLDGIPRAYAQVDAGAAGDGGLPPSGKGGPKRLIIMFSPNGTIPSAWSSTGSGASFTPGQILQPLVTAGHQNDIIVVQNLDTSASMDGPGGDAHGLGIGCLLDGIELASGSMFLAGCGLPGQFCGSSGWPGGITIDQFIAQKLAAPTPHLSIDFAVKNMAASLWSRMSYTGPNGLTVEPYFDPTVAFNQLFANVGMSSSSVALQTMRRKSILDEVTGELSALSATLSGTDKFKVDAHLTQLRQIETGLQAPAMSSCVKPAAPMLTASAPVMINGSGMEVHGDPSVDADVPQRNKLAQQMLVAAMACDMARVGTIMMAPSRSDIFFSWLTSPVSGISYTVPNESHHDLSHESNSNTAAQQGLIAINQWYATQVAQMITLLKQQPENGGTMFDNTVLLWCNELGIGNVHSHTDVPVLLAGSAGGYLKTGQAVTMPAGTPYNRLHLSLANAMGLTGVTTFGNPKFCANGPIAEIQA
jgi:hypothetical protein